MTNEARRVLFISFDSIGPNLGGSAIRVLGLARALAELGHAVTIAASRVETGYPDLPASVFAFDETRPRESPRLPVESSDVIVLPLHGIARLPFLKRSPAPLVFDLYDPLMLELLETNADAADLRGHVQLLNQVLRRGDFFLAASQRQRDFWLGALAANGRLSASSLDAARRDLIDVVGFGIDPAAPPESAIARLALVDAIPALANAKAIVVSPGNPWEWTDPASLLQAVQMLTESLPELHLIFFGDRDATRKVRAQADVLGLAGRTVHFVDRHLPYDQRGQFLAGCDAAISTHRASLESRFAYRARFFDCFWAGLPIVCTEGDVIAEMVAEHALGIVVRPDDPEALARALERIATDAEFRASCRKRIRARREFFTWQNAAEPLARFCDRPRSGHLRSPTADARMLIDSAWRVLRRQGVTETLRRFRRHLQSR